METELLDTDAAVREIEENGFILLRDIVSKDQLEALDGRIRAEYERLRDSGELFEGGGNISGHLNCYPGEGSRFVLDDLTSHGVIDIIDKLSPDGVGRLRPNCNINLPGSVAQHYHIDGYFSQAFYTCTVAVVDTDLRNGAIDVLPGTNRQFYKFWQYALQRKYRLTTRVPMKRGDVIVRKSTLWHRGMPNHSPAMRPQLTFTFGEGGAPTGDPFKEHDGTIAFEPNWFKTDRVGQLREWVFVKVPYSYSSYRFVRSLFGNKGYAPEARFGDFTAPPSRRFLPSRRRAARP